MFILFLSLLWPLAGNAQQEGNVWTFGLGGGIDFTTGVPVAFQSAMGHIEGCASIANADGQLLFYTDGDRIYNRTHQIMPNGVLFYGLPYPLWGAGPIYSSTQSSLILPFPGDSLKYYVFSLASAAFGYLWYSVVDMSLDNGLGNVVANKKNIMLNNGPLSEKMTAVRGNNCNAWLMVHNQAANNYLAYEINASGINTTPVTSPAIAPTSAVGVIKFSPDRQRMAAASYGDDNGSQAFSLYAFNPTTGILNFELQLDTAGAYYGTCFSPDNSKLYATNYGGNLFQFDLTQPTQAAIVSSKTTLGTSANGDLKAGPDGRVYFSNAGGTFIGSINQPNLTGAASAVVSNAVALIPGTIGYYGLPNEIVLVKDTNTSRTYDLLVCFRDSLLLQGNPTGFNYQWEDGTTSSDRMVYQSGTYRLSYETACKTFTDTFNVILQKLPLLTVDSICPGSGIGGITAVAKDNTPYTYTWKNNTGVTISTQESQTGAMIRGMEAGDYTLRLTSSAGCDTTISLTVHSYPEVTIEVEPDIVTIPYGDSIQLHATGADYYHWWPSGTVSNDTISDPFVRPLSPLVYTVLGLNLYGCRDTATVQVNIDYRMPDFIPNAFSPNGDGKNDVFRIEQIRYQKLVQFRVFNRWGQQLFETIDGTNGWDGTHNGMPCDVDTYYYIISLNHPDGTTKTYKGDIILVR